VSRISFAGRVTLKSDKEKKKPSFHKIEDGMVFFSEDGEVLAVGFPTEVEKKTAGEGGVDVGFKGIGGKAGGEQYSKIKYEWRYLSESPLPPEKKEEIDKQIAVASGTVVTGSANLTPLVAVMCPKCFKGNEISSEFCSACGTKLRR